MRFYFKNLTRPKQVAQAIQSYFPLIKLSQTQKWTAQIYGYRDWHDLEEVTKAGLHEPSQYDEDLPEQEAYERSVTFDIRAAEVLGLNYLLDFTIVPSLHVTSRNAPKQLHRAKGLPKDGLPLFKVIQTDLLSDGDCRTTEALSIDDRLGYDIPPDDFGTEDAIIKKLVSMMRRHPFNQDFPDDCERLLRGPFSTDVFFDYPLEGDDEEVLETFLLIQFRRRRLFVFDPDGHVKGFVIFEMSVAAAKSYDGANEFEVRVVEAWAPPRDRETWFAILNHVASSMIYTLDVIRTACKGIAGPLDLDLTLISDSEFLLSKGLLADIRDMAAHSSDLPADYFDIHYDT